MSVRFQWNPQKATHNAQKHRLLIVSFTERQNVIRIISARKADQDEREEYENAKR
jgi:uncharacterized DUF497 family protein